jgi:chromosome partitioning protein
MRTIAIINQKGGCGKTTTSINLAACLARLGQKTLLVDMDPQGHCAIGLAVPEEQIERTIYDALIEDRDGKPARLSEVVWQIASDFDLAPSNLKLAAFEQTFAGRLGREDRLRKALDGVRETYRWCIVDCPPSVGLITFNALRACDEAIVPVETGYFSLHGLARMMETLELMRNKCDQEILIRVLPTLYDTRTKLAREVLCELRGRFKDYLMDSAVNFNTKLKEAASFGQPITEYDPGSRGYKDFVNLARELMGQRPTETEAIPMDQLSRPAELVQRARQLAQLTNLQFGRNSLKTADLDETEEGGDPDDSPIPLSEPEPAPAQESWVQALERGESAYGGALDTAKVASALCSEQEELDDSGEGEYPLSFRVAQEQTAEPNKTTAQKIEEFYGVKQVGGEVMFAVRFSDAQRVLIAGDFNNWSPVSTPMINRGRPGEFFTRLPLRPGRYRYRFIVDGKWVTDPHNSYVEVNQFGELNNVVEVE